MKSYNYSFPARVVRKIKCALIRHGRSREADRHIYTLLTLIIIAFVALMLA